MANLLQLSFAQAETLARILDGGLETLRGASIADISAVNSFLGMGEMPDISEEEAKEIIEIEKAEYQSIRQQIKLDYGI